MRAGVGVCIRFCPGRGRRQWEWGRATLPALIMHAYDLAAVARVCCVPMLYAIARRWTFLPPPCRHFNTSRGCTSMADAVQGARGAAQIFAAVREHRHREDDGHAGAAGGPHALPQVPSRDSLPQLHPRCVWQHSRSAAAITVYGCPASLWQVHRPWSTAQSGDQSLLGCSCDANSVHAAV